MADEATMKFGFLRIHPNNPAYHLNKLSEMLEANKKLQIWQCLCWHGKI